MTATFLIQTIRLQASKDYGKHLTIIVGQISSAELQGIVCGHNNAVLHSLTKEAILPPAT